MFENLGGEKLLLILIVFFIFFGGKKIPEMAQGIGKGIREFKKALNDVHDDIKDSGNTESKDEKK
jgi:sec-independent protein translocase protein TatA